MAESIPELVAAIPTGSGTFISKHNPVRMGNAANIGYGGCATAFAVNASAATVDTEKYRAYSVLGHFLSGSKADRPLHAIVTHIRSTHAFATRTVIVSQIQDDKTSRTVLSAHIDYHRREPASLLTYSPPVPQLTVLKGEQSSEYVRSLPGVQEGHIRALETAFAPALKYFERSSVPEGISAQNMFGILKKAKTTQDDRALVDKTSYDSWRSRASLNSYVEHLSTLSFQMDGAISFIPLTHSHLFLQDAAACSSLDFALRIFENDLDLDKWHIREFKTVTGGSGRTYSVSKVWDESGRLVAEMTQQSILRPLDKSRI